MKNLFVFVSILLFAASCQSYSKHPISDAKAELYDTRLEGKWKLQEDTNKNNYYLVKKGSPTEGPKYHVMFFDRGGKNRTYESTVYFSKVGKDLFLNMPYFFRNAARYADIHKDYEENGGYFFLRVLNADKAYNKLTLTVVNDDKLATIKSSKEVYARIKSNMNKASYYHDTVHLYKVQ